MQLAGLGPAAPQEEAQQRREVVRAGDEALRWPVQRRPGGEHLAVQVPHRLRREEFWAWPEAGAGESEWPGHLGLDQRGERRLRPQLELQRSRGEGGPRGGIAAARRPAQRPVAQAQHRGERRVRRVRGQQVARGEVLEARGLFEQVLEAERSGERVGVREAQLRCVERGLQRGLLVFGVGRGGGAFGCPGVRSLALLVVVRVHLGDLHFVGRGPQRGEGDQERRERPGGERRGGLHLARGGRIGDAEARDQQRPFGACERDGGARDVLLHEDLRDLPLQRVDVGGEHAVCRRGLRRRRCIGWERQHQLRGGRGLGRREDQRRVAGSAWRRGGLRARSPRQEGQEGSSRDGRG